MLHSACRAAVVVSNDQPLTTAPPMPP